MMRKQACLTLVLLSTFFSAIGKREGDSQLFTGSDKKNTDTILLPLGGNTWRSGAGSGEITDEGIANWIDKSVSFTAYVRLKKAGWLKVALDGTKPLGKSSLEVQINGRSQKISWNPEREGPVDAGTWRIEDTGYVAIKIKGVSKTGKVFAQVQNLLLSGSATEGGAAFVKNNKNNFFYWGRRGPSVHLNYKTPEEKDIEWFYNEVTVPEGNDVIGSYYMADGFNGGYFGMQVNSAKERRILFSVWSPYQTDNPEEIPDAMRIQLLKKGKNVRTGKFGNEGSGGQSYLIYPWKAGNTYKFLLHGLPVDSSHTVFTAYFYAPEEGEWRLIASFSRPKTHTYLKGLYSFLENFSTRNGNKERQVNFGNQWVRTTEGKWIELNKITFTADNTGRKGYRMDYAGGVKNKQFYLKNCGFFNAYTPIGSRFERPKTGKQPAVKPDQF